MCVGDCIVCDETLYDGEVALGIAHTDILYCYKCLNHIQPERASEEDHQKLMRFTTPAKKYVKCLGEYKTVDDDMRCSEHSNERE